MTKKISTLLCLEDSVARVLKEERQGRKLIPDALCLCDCEILPNDTLKSIKESLDSGSYQPRGLLRMDVPKDNFCIRPAAVPTFEDWVVYDAFAHYIGQNADPKLNARVFSFRFNKSGELMPGVVQWKTFENSFWRAFESSGPNAYVLSTDIASYFANINLSVLRTHLLTVLSQSSTNERIVNHLFQSLLKPWAKGPLQSDLGIPQGVNASSILGNLLPHHLDAEMLKIQGIKYFRYVDDLRIITPDRVTAKKTLRVLIKALGQIGLDVNTSKTRIVDKARAKELKDPRAEEMNLVETLIKSKRRTNINLALLSLLTRIFDGAFEEGNTLYQRHLSFAINRFVLLRNELKRNKNFIKKISAVLISNLERLPACTEDFSRFFRNFPSSIYKKNLLSFVQGIDNIYEWQEMWILDSLLRFQHMTPNELEFFETIARNRGKHTLCRAKAILLMGQFGDHHLRHELTTIYKDETDSVVKRAIVFACQELATAERNVFYDMVAVDEEMKHTLTYVKQLKKPKYYEQESWGPIDIPDAGTY